MNRRSVITVMLRDLRLVMQSQTVLGSILAVPLVIFIGLPLLGVFLPGFINIPGLNLAHPAEIISRMPAGLQADLAGYATDAQKGIVLILVYLLAPMFLIVPLMMSNVIAADSFAGEKERKTLEALLYTPTTDNEILLGKMLAAWLPAVGVSIVGFVLYGLVSNLAGWHVMSSIFFPNTMWLILVLWVAPAAAGLGLSVMVLISSRAHTFQEAYQIGGAVVVPVMLLLVGQALGLMYFNNWLALGVGLVLWIIDAVLFYLGVRSFKRGELIARL